ncbi:MAG: hypothetical protein AB2L13_07075 [Spirochaetota bacterium]
MARRELEDWIVAECYRVASGAAAPAGWIEPRGDARRGLVLF